MILCVILYSPDLYSPDLCTPHTLPTPHARPREQGGGRAAVVIGDVPDSYQQLQVNVSAKLARDHPELSESLCVEMLGRQLRCAALRHQVLSALLPWAENIQLSPRWQGTWAGSLLRAMYDVTGAHGGSLPREVERLWSTVAANKRNVLPVLDFLVAKGVDECEAQDKVRGVAGGGRRGCKHGSRHALVFSRGWREGGIHPRAAGGKTRTH